MKMRKMISLCGALAIAASTFSTVALADIATTELTLNPEVTPVDDATFVEYYEESIPEGKAAYFVDFTVSGVADELSYTKTAGTNAKPKYSGTALDVMEIILKADNLAVIDQDYSYIVDNALSAAPTEGFSETGWETNYFGNFIYPAAKDTVGVEDGTTSSLFKVCFVIDADATVNFTIADATLSLLEYTDSTIANQVDYTKAAGALKLATDTITLAPAAPEVKELTIEATEVTNASATNKGYAWKIAGTTGEADLAGFSADFTADGVTKTKNATGLPEIKGGADYEFYVALRLSSVDAIDSASFTVTDAADATATATWNK